MRSAPMRSSPVAKARPIWGETPSTWKKFACVEITDTASIKLEALDDAELVLIDLDE